MKKIVMICMAILAVVVMTNCSQKGKYVNRYYCYDDDDGMEIIFKDNGTVECLFGITRVHLKGTYQCEFPNVFVRFPNDSIQIADCVVYDLPNLDSLKFNADADTLYVYKSHADLLVPASTMQLTPHNVISHYFFKIGL